VKIEFKQKAIRIVFYSGSAVLGILGFVFLLTLKVQPAAKGKVEQWLGIQLPESASEFHYYYSQAPGYYQAILFTRFKISESDFISLMMGAGFDKANKTTLVQKLPTDFNLDPRVQWWNPPQDQSDRFFLSTNNIETICVWYSGYAFFEKNGAFGSMWNRKVVQSN